MLAYAAMFSRLGLLGVTIIAAALAGCSPSSPETALLDEVVTALGGAEAIRSANTLVLDGVGSSYNLGQNANSDGELPTFEVTEYRRAIDFAGGRWQVRWTREPRYLTGNTNPRIQTLGLDNGVAFNVTGNGNLQRMSELEGRLRRTGLSMHPIGLLRVALDPASRVLDKRSVGGVETLNIITTDGEFILYVDPQTKLPAKIQSTIYHANLGNVIAEIAFEDYDPVDGLLLPTRFTHMLDRFVVAELTLTNSLNSDTGDLSAPDSVKSATVPVPRATVEVEEVARGIWYLTGQSHHSVVAELSDHLVLIEAPQNDTRTLAVIEQARQLNPDKPLTHVINTHHHSDHAGGIRAAISEGLTIITHERNRALYEDIAARSHRLSPDALERNPKPLMLETISEKHVLEEGTRAIELYPIEESRHANTLLMVYFPAQRILTFADVFTPAPPNALTLPRFPFVANLLANIENYGLRVNRVMPIHGRIVPIAEVRAAAEAEAERGK